MPKLKALSGNEVIKILQSFGFEIIGQKAAFLARTDLANADNVRVL